MSSYIVLLAVLIGPAIYFITKIWRFINEVRRLGTAAEQFPGEPKHWLWGHLHEYPGPNEAGLALQVEMTIKYPRVSCAWFGCFTPLIILNHPETMQPLLRTSEPKPLGFGAYQFGKPWLGDGLLISRGAKHQRNRKLLTPAFHFEILKTYVDVKNRATELMLKRYEACADSEKCLEIFSTFSLCTLDIILRCAFSYESDIQQKGESHPYVNAVIELSELWVKRFLKPWLYPDCIYTRTKDGKKFKEHCNFVHSVSQEIIKQRKQKLAEEGEAAMKKGRYIDFLDILLTAKDEDGQGLSDIDIRNEVDTFLFEGHDTTASGLSWTLYSLAKNPEYQEKCQEEIDEIFKDKENNSIDIEWEDLPKLKYLSMCIKEALRLHSPVSFIERQLTRDLEIDGKVLPHGTILAIQIYNLHHNPVVWGEDHMEYKPSRFLPEVADKRDPYAFLPFSAGPRNCIGQNFAMHEMKIILAKILHRFTISLDPDHIVEKKISVVMRAKDGIKCRVALRT